MDFGDDDVKQSTPQDAKPQDAKQKKNVAFDETNLNKPKQKSEFRINFESTSWLWRISSSVFITGYLCHVVAYGTPYWLNISDVTGNNNTHVGLWSECLAITNCTYRDDISGCMNTVRGFGSIAVVWGLVVCLLLLCYIRRPIDRRCMSVTTVTSCFVTALSIQISSAVFARTSGCLEDVDASLAVFDWSLSLTFASVLLVCIAGTSFFIHELRICSKRKSGRRSKNTIGMNIT